ncbi:MAG: CPBP family intramembrane glutamic endopeptidase [Hyphomicrobiales bacterium]
MTEPRRLIAPIRHTVILILVFLATAAYGAYLQHAAGDRAQLVASRGSALPLYLTLIVMEWMLLYFVFFGIRKTGTRLRDLVGPGWATPGAVARDVALALVVWFVWRTAEAVVDRALGPDTAKGVGTLLPRGPMEIGVWIVLSVSAGICEEAVFRGYFQAQFRALWGSAALAVAVQAVVFGVAHGYQGVRNVITITVLGLVYGAVVVWRRNLRPTMILHAWMDVVGGILGARG